MAEDGRGGPYGHPEPVSATFALVLIGLAAGTWLMWRIPTPSPGAEPAEVARASVIIPARNEEASLARLLDSLDAQPRPPKEIIVVDDGSEDATATLAARAGVTVVAAPPRPAGWVGKPWACHIGAGAATGDTLVFLDADTVLGFDGLERVVGAHGAFASDGLLSVQPFHRTVRTYEQLSAFCNVVSMMATGAFRPGDERDHNVAYGPCLVTSAVAYRRAGGHAAVAGEVVEDVQLARAHRRVGQAVHCLAGGDAISFRMYPSGLGQLIEGWTKDLASGAGLVSPLPMLGAVAWVAACATVGAEGVVAAVHAGESSFWPLIGWLLVAGQLTWLLRRLGSFRWWTAVAFPIPLAAFLAIFLRSCVHRSIRRSVRWRGRTIDLGGAAR